MFRFLNKNFSTKMQASSTKNKKDSAGRRLGVKIFHGQEVFPNDIIVRQRGLKWKPGQNVFIGKDHTLHSKVEGEVIFDKQYKDNGKKVITVGVLEKEITNKKIKNPSPYCYHPEQFPELALNNPKPLINKVKEKKEKNVYNNFMQYKFKEEYYKLDTYEKIEIKLKNLEIPENFNDIENEIIPRSKIIKDYIENINLIIENN